MKTLTFTRQAQRELSSAKAVPLAVAQRGDLYIAGGISARGKYVTGRLLLARALEREPGHGDMSRYSDEPYMAAGMGTLDRYSAAGGREWSVEATADGNALAAAIGEELVEELIRAPDVQDRVRADLVPLVFRYAGVAPGSVSTINGLAVQSMGGDFRAARS